MSKSVRPSSGFQLRVMGMTIPWKGRSDEMYWGGEILSSPKLPNEYEPYSLNKNNDNVIIFTTVAATATTTTTTTTTST